MRAAFVVCFLLLASGVLAQDAPPALYAPYVPDPARAADGRLIGLKAVGLFDPLRHVPDFAGLIPGKPPGLEEPAQARRYRLAQFYRRVSPAAQEALRESGLEVIGYVPNNALVVAIPPGASEEALRSAPGIRYVGPFLEGYKLDPDLFRLLRREDRAGLTTLALDVQLFPGESPDPLLEAVEKHGKRKLLPTLITHGRRGGPSRVTFEIPVEALESAVGLFLHLPSVAYVERRLPPELYNDDLIWIGQSYDRLNGPGEANDLDPKPYSQSATIWNQGLRGAGQVVAVADTGLETGTCFWNDPLHPVVPQQVTPPGPLVVDPDHRKILAVNGVNSFTLDFDGTWRHGTHVAGTVAGDDLANPAGGPLASHDHGDGVAPETKIIFEDIGGPQSGSCSTTLWVASVEDLLEQEYNAEARISTNSWGEQDTRADEVDRSVWNHEDFLVLFAAGNMGTGGISGIANNKNGITVAAGENYDEEFVDVFGILDPENLAAFSSLGPALDGRVKPDLVAPGYQVRSNNFPTQYIPDQANCDPMDPTIEVCVPSFGGCYFTHTSETCSVNPLQGTSMATPTVAGLAALARQYFLEGFYPTGRTAPADSLSPSAALLKAIILNGARNMTGHRFERRGTTKTDFGPLEDAPSSSQGWGRVMLDDALYFMNDSRRLRLLDVANPNGLSTNETATLQFTVTASDQPLKLILAWTDPPAQSYVTLALINDLDLEITAPDGTVYRGNQWTADNVNVPGDKESLPNPAGRDALNNVEGILIQTPQTGLYDLSIRGANVPGHLGVFTQGYALTITGAVSDPAGSVPDGSTVAGTPLTVDKASGGDIALTWGSSCHAADGDFEIYEGTLGSFTSHGFRFCTTGGATAKTFTPAAGSRYYLVVPRSFDDEGSYGTDSSNVQRPPGDPACLAQEIAPCD